MNVQYHIFHSRFMAHHGIFLRLSVAWQLLFNSVQMKMHFCYPSAICTDQSSVFRGLFAKYLVLDGEVIERVYLCPYKCWLLNIRNIEEDYAHARRLSMMRMEAPIRWFIKVVESNVLELGQKVGRNAGNRTCTLGHRHNVRWYVLYGFSYFYWPLS